MHRGYTKRWRKRWDKGIQQDHLLWVMMDYFIDFAAWKDNKFPFFWKGKLVEMVAVKRGQCFFTITALAEFFTGPLNKVSRDMVRKRVNTLEKIGFLSREKPRQYQIVTVLNYDRYNPIEESEPQQKPRSSHGNATATPQQRHTSNKVNKLKERKEGGVGDEFFSLRERYTDQPLIDRTIDAIATTRKSGVVAQSVIVAQLKKWDRYPVDQVQSALRKYLERDYAGQGKGEAYLLGIIRNTQPEPTTPVVDMSQYSQEALERAIS